MPSDHPLPTFLGVTVPVELVTSLRDYERLGNSVVLRCATARYRPELYDYYGTRCETVFDPPTPAPDATVRLDFCDPAIVRVRYFPGPEVPAHDTPMLVGQFDHLVELDLTQDEHSLTIQTAALRLVVTREPWQLTAYGLDGALIWETRPVDLAPLRRGEAQWNPSEQRWQFVHRYAYPLGHANSGPHRRAFASFGLQHDEHIYGFGESFGSFDKRGTRQRLWLMEGFSNSAPGSSYKRVPFYMSTRGYGLFVNTSHAVDFRVGDLDHTALSVDVYDENLLDFFLIYGPQLKDILPRYTAITGRPGLPPRWSFGLWMSQVSFHDQDEVLAMASELRRRRIPCDVIHIDTDWFAEEWVCDLRFGPTKFPDPAAMIAALREQGFRLSLWQWPNLLVGSPLFEEGQAGGYLVRRISGAVYTYSGFREDAGLIDYSNPEAVAWIQEKFRRLFRLGVAVIKTDFGEGAPPTGVYAGAEGAAMHNLYPLLYNRAVFAVTEEMHGAGQGVVWSRSAWAGSQRYPVHWSGDGIARFEDLACVLSSALSFGLSGFPFYSHDIGGFVGLPSPDLYVRWAQLGLFSSHARLHGMPPRAPWAYGQEAERLFRRYADLRYRLMPYIYSEAVRCTQHSLPMLRPLVLEYQDDPTTHTLASQYLFGRSLLVAPMLDESPRRWVYLPQGDWVDYWNKAMVPGGRWLQVEAGLETLPLYVRGGDILPYGPPRQHTGEQGLDPLTLELYAPQRSGAFTLYGEDHPPVKISYERDRQDLTVRVENAPGQVAVHLYHAEVDRARVRDQEVRPSRAEDGSLRLAFDGRATQQVVFYPADPTPQEGVSV